MTTITIERSVLEQAIDSAEAMLMHFNFARLKASGLNDSEVRVNAHNAIKHLRAALSAPATAPEELERLRKDAERYQWLRSRPIFWAPFGHEASAEKLDSGIDAAMNYHDKHTNQ